MLSPAPRQSVAALAAAFPKPGARRYSASPWTTSNNSSKPRQGRPSENESAARRRALLVLINLMLRPAGEDLFFPPGRHVAKRLAADEVGKRLFFRPFAGDQVRGVVGRVFPEGRVRMPRGTLK